MHIFHLHAEKRQGRTGDTRKWLVVADTLPDAVSLVPDGFCLESVEVQVARVPGPAGVVGCFVQTDLLRRPRSLRSRPFDAVDL